MSALLRRWFGSSGASAGDIHPAVRDVGTPVDATANTPPSLPKGTLERDRLHPVTLILNGRTRHGVCESRELLSDFLRHGLGATGTHVGCEHGVCGACTVRIDGVAGRACMTLAVQAEGRSVDTVEGLADADGTLNDLQQAFRRHHALQCGFCTAGILMSTADYLERVLACQAAQQTTRAAALASEHAIREMLSGHLCRCTGYTPIVAAVSEVLQQRLEQHITRAAPAPMPSTSTSPSIPTMDAKETADTSDRVPTMSHPPEPGHA